MTTVYILKCFKLSWCGMGLTSFKTVCEGGQGQGRRRRSEVRRRSDGDEREDGMLVHRRVIMTSFGLQNKLCKLA